MSCVCEGSRLLASPSSSMTSPRSRPFKTAIPLPRSNHNSKPCRPTRDHLSKMSYARVGVVTGANKGIGYAIGKPSPPLLVLHHTTHPPQSANSPSNTPPPNSTPAPSSSTSPPATRPAARRPSPPSPPRTPPSSRPKPCAPSAASPTSSSTSSTFHINPVSSRSPTSSAPSTPTASTLSSTTPAWPWTAST